MLVQISSLGILRLRTAFLLIIAVAGWGMLSPDAQAAACQNALSKSVAVPNGYGASYNLFSAAGETLISGVDCTAASARVQMGSGAANQYISNQGYHWNGTQWQPFSLTGSGTQQTGAWLVGSAQAQISLTKSPTFVLGYICQYESGAWKCGCRDKACATPHWQLQAVQGTAAVPPNTGEGGTGAGGSLKTPPDFSSMTEIKSYTRGRNESGAMYSVGTDAHIKRGYFLMKPEYWAAGDARFAAGDFLTTRTYEKDGLIRQRMTWKLTDPGSGGNYFPYGAPYITMGKHYEEQSFQSPFRSTNGKWDLNGKTDGMWWSDVSSLKVSGGASLIQRNSTSAFFVAVQSYMYGFQHTGNCDQCNVFIDLQIRWLMSGYKWEDGKSNVPGAPYIDEKGRKWLVRHSTSESPNKHSWSIFLINPGPPENWVQEPNAIDNLDIKRMVDAFAPQMKASIGSNDLWFRQFSTWVEPLKGQADISLDGLEVQLNGGTYGKVAR